MLGFMHDSMVVTYRIFGIALGFLFLGSTTSPRWASREHVHRGWLVLRLDCFVDFTRLLQVFREFICLATPTPHTERFGHLGLRFQHNRVLRHLDFYWYYIYKHRCLYAGLAVAE